MWTIPLQLRLKNSYTLTDQGIAEQCWSDQLPFHQSGDDAMPDTLVCPGAIEETRFPLLLAVHTLSHSPSTFASRCRHKHASPTTVKCTLPATNQHVRHIKPQTGSGCCMHCSSCVRAQHHVTPRNNTRLAEHCICWRKLPSCCLNSLLCSLCHAKVLHLPTKACSMCYINLFGAGLIPATLSLPLLLLLLLPSHRPPLCRRLR